MIRIGICDDNKKDIEYLQQICEKYFSLYGIEHEYKIFFSGEEVLAFCKDNKKGEECIDLLFLDIEMSGINGIEVKDKILKEYAIWRIVFVTSHLESMKLAFGLKTMGFENKPVEEERICHWIRLIVEEKQKKVLIEIPNVTSENRTYVPLEDITYVKAGGNYIDIYFSAETGNEPLLITMQLKQLEKEWEHLPFIRVHKSYMVNLVNIEDVGQTICLRGSKEQIPIGRSYKNMVRQQYYEYGKKVARRRI